MKAVCLLSGGVDSATALAVAKNLGFEVYALSFDYRQRHHVELEAAGRLAKQLGAHEHKTLRIDLRAFGGSALTDDMAVPKARHRDEMTREIPITYVPARNTVFLSLALAWAEVLAACDIFIGVNAVDYSGYPDCRPEFIRAFERLANLATRAGVEGQRNFRVHTPLIELSKGGIIQLGTKLGVDFSLTHSCYDPVGTKACGQCDSCLIRLAGFAEAGIADPVEYVR